MPGIAQQRGATHPLTQVQKTAMDVMRRLGFHLAEGPEVDTPYYNFDALNIPENHPVAAAAGFAMSPDIAIVNWYTNRSKMGLHQDKDEIESLDSGAPVVSISIGDTAKFLFGGVKATIPSRRSCSSPETPSSSAAPRGCDITASRGFCQAPHRQAWTSKDD